MKCGTATASMSGHIGSGIVGFGTLGGRTEATGGENEDGHDPLSMLLQELFLHPNSLPEAPRWASTSVCSVAI
jgi:hypothetical protein